MLYAHRGANRQAPENTLAAFRAALDAGVDAIETDVHLTRDDHVVISHDATGARTAGVARAIADSTLAEVAAWNVGSATQQAHIPTLAETLDTLPAARFNIDIKQHDQASVERVLDVVRKRGAERRVLLTSFSSRVTREVQRRGYAGPIGLGRGECVRAVLLGGWGLRLDAARRAQLPLRQGPLDLTRSARIAKLHARGLAVDYWVVNDVRLAEQLLDRGADGIVTDDPPALAPLFERHPRTRGWRERHGRA
jgi:glycerophosphoryl diester phosphodiesterase